MNEAVGILLVILFYYSSALLPLGYLVATRLKGRRRRAFLIGLGAQIFASLLIIVLTYWCRSAGYTEWFWAMACNIPVNVLFAVTYIIISCRSARETPVSA